MAERNVVEVLERIVREVKGERIDEEIDASDDFFDMGEYSEMQAVEDEFLEKHAHAVERVTLTWGEPAFAGSPEDEGFPAWADEEAVAFACWPRGPEKIAYISLPTHDKETPYFLTVGARPNETARKHGW